MLDRIGDLSRKGFRTSVGGGISFRSPVGLLAKLQVGHSEVEKLKVGFTVEQDF